MSWQEGRITRVAFLYGGMETKDQFNHVSHSHGLTAQPRILQSFATHRITFFKKNNLMQVSSVSSNLQNAENYFFVEKRLMEYR